MREAAPHVAVLPEGALNRRIHLRALVGKKLMDAR